MAQANSEFVLNVELVEENSEHTEMNVLSFSSRPSTFREVRGTIEERFEIPACVQSLRYEGNIVAADVVSPETLYLQSGDTVQIVYPAKGATKDVIQAVDWLSQSCKILRENREVNARSTNTIFHQYQVSTIGSGDVYAFLTRDMFTSLRERIVVNCRHFDYIGGVQVLVEFHNHLVDVRMRRKSDTDLKPLILFELMCCTAMACFCMNECLAGRIVQCGGLETLNASFLSFPADYTNLTNDGKLVIAEGLRGIYNVVDLIGGKCLELAYDKVINQCLIVINSSMLKSFPTDRWAVSLLLCLSRCREIHENLVKPDVIEELLASFEINQVDDKSTVLKSYVGATIAQLSIPSGHLLKTFPVTLLKKMLTFLNNALCDHSVRIQEYETNRGYYWATFQSCLECIYEPLYLSEQEFPEENSISLTRILQTFSITMLLQFLQNCLGRRVHVDIIVKEGLLDYVIPLPWMLPTRYESKAKSVIREVAKFTPIQPPSLVRLAKASIAMNKCGLYKLKNLDSVSQLCML